MEITNYYIGIIHGFRMCISTSKKEVKRYFKNTRKIKEKDYNIYQQNLSDTDVSFGPLSKLLLIERYKILMTIRDLEIINMEWGQYQQNIYKISDELRNINRPIKSIDSLGELSDQLKTLENQLKKLSENAKDLDNIKKRFFRTSYILTINFQEYGYISQSVDEIKSMTNEYRRILSTNL